LQDAVNGDLSDLNNDIADEHYLNQLNDQLRDNHQEAPYFGY
jgi:hypothetical protein